MPPNISQSSPNPPGLAIWREAPYDEPHTENEIQERPHTKLRVGLHLHKAKGPNRCQQIYSHVDMCSSQALYSPCCYRFPPHSSHPRRQNLRPTQPQRRLRNVLIKPQQQPPLILTYNSICQTRRQRGYPFILRDGNTASRTPKNTHIASISPTSNLVVSSPSRCV